MPVTLTIEVDGLSPDLAKNLAGFLMACAGVDLETEEPATVIAPPAAVIAGDSDKEELEAESLRLQRYRVDDDPAQAFGAISQLGPSLVIPAQPADPAAAPNPTPPPPPANAGVTLDKAGLPWDARIHVGSKTFNGDGTWRRKRGVDETIVAQVEAELQRVMAIPGPVAVPPPPVQATATIPAPPPAPAPSQASQMEFVNLVGRASSAMAQGKISEEQLAQCCQAVGIPSLPMLGARLDLVSQVAGMIDGIIAGKSA